MAELLKTFHERCRCRHGCPTSASISEWRCGCVTVTIHDDRLAGSDCTNFSERRHWCGERPSDAPKEHGESRTREREPAQQSRPFASEQREERPATRSADSSAFVEQWVQRATKTDEAMRQCAWLGGLAALIVGSTVGSLVRGMGDLSSLLVGLAVASPVFAIVFWWRMKTLMVDDFGLEDNIRGTRTLLIIGSSAITFCSLWALITFNEGSADRPPPPIQVQESTTPPPADLPSVSATPPTAAEIEAARRRGEDAMMEAGGEQDDGVSASQVIAPRWLARVSPNQLVEHYPTSAREAGVEARVVLDCGVAADGRISCIVTSEDPPGWGFGVASLEVARSFRIAPQFEDGQPTDNGRITVPLRWQLN